MVFSYDTWYGYVVAQEWRNEKSVGEVDIEVGGWVEEKKKSLIGRLIVMM